LLISGGVFFMFFPWGFSQESLADQVRVLVKTASSEETIVLKPEVTEHEFHDLIPAAGAGAAGVWWVYLVHLLGE